MEKGYIKLSRKFFDNEIWQAARAFSECEAWLDLIQSARFEASTTTSCFGSCKVTWGRGQYPASVRFLSKKWGRGERWVRVFLTKLKKEGMITVENSQGVSIITLVNYDKYNDSPKVPNDTAKDTANDTPNYVTFNQLQEVVTQVVTQVMTQQSKLGHSYDTNKKKEEINYKEISLSRDKEIPQLEKDIKMPLDECHAYILKNYSQWVETVTMNIRSSGFPDFTMDSFKDYLRRFFEKLKNEGEDGKSPSDAQSHFYRWLVIQLGNAPKNAYLSENNRLLECLPDGMYKRFVGMVHDFAPFCFANMKMPSEEEVDGFKHMFESTKTIREALMQVENNTELRRKREYLGQTIRDQLAITKKINT